MRTEKSKRDAVIVAYGRSPMAKANKGSFAQMHPIEYAAQTLQGVLGRLPGLDPIAIDDIVVGCAEPEAETFFNVGRLIAQRAGLPDDVTGHTINRFCSSGLQAIATAANAIMANQMDIVVAGGLEHMTNMNMNPNMDFADQKLIELKPDTYIPMGITAENVAAKYGITRQEMDKMAVESHKKASNAAKAGKFKDEIIPIKVETDESTFLVTEDEGIREGTNIESLSNLEPCFKEDGVVTAATSSQMTDAASFVVVMAREKAEELGYQSIARFLGFAVGGVPAGVMGIGPMKAVPKIMKLTGLSVENMDVIELNEAFAAQALACIRELKFPYGKVNPNGGAMALGHPMGATGSILTCKVLSELKRTAGRYGLVTMCVGGGMGAAAIYEMEQS